LGTKEGTFKERTSVFNRNDLLYQIGKEEELLKRLQEKLNKNKNKEMVKPYRLTKIHKNKG
jgi:hypothetical protein